MAGEKLSRAERRALRDRRRVIITADDFGMSESINEAVERACRDGILNTASLMVAGPAAGDAVRRAKALPQLRVGLHLVVVEGASVRPSAVKGLVDAAGDFPKDQFGVSLNYFFLPKQRKQLHSEIRSQFSAFAKTGLRLDHANAHKHMHLHPTVGRMMIEIGKTFGLPAIRVPYEPTGPLSKAGTRVGVGGRMLNLWSSMLRDDARRAKIQVNDNVFGIAWSGHMTTERILRLIPNLPKGLTEIYFHPAAWRDGRIATLMEDYEHEAELAALLSPEVREALDAAGIERTGYGEP
jgi:hopanoid biosynthesis associated protein HpnK